MTVRNFQGISMLKEVECSGATLSQEVELLTSLALFRPTDNTALVYLNFVKQECKTFNEYSSCSIDASDSKRSSVKTLLADLREGETLVIACNVTALQGIGHSPRFTWTIPVHRESKIISNSFTCYTCLLLCDEIKSAFFFFFLQ
jgi:hypothetical protein